MIGAILAAALQSTAVAGPYECQVSFDTQRRNARNLSINCPHGMPDRAGAEAEIRRQIETADLPRSNLPVMTDVLTFGVTDAGNTQWYVTSIVLDTVFPQTPSAALNADIHGECAVRFHVIEGEVQAAGSRCLDPAHDRYFERSNAEAVEGRTYTRGLPVLCGWIAYQYNVTDDMPPVPEVEPPSCEYPDGYEAHFPEPLRPYIDLVSRFDSVATDAFYDPQSGRAYCELELAAMEGGGAGLQLRCPQNAPDLGALQALMGQALGQVDLGVESHNGYYLEDILMADYSPSGGWQLPEGQIILTRLPAADEDMQRRRASGHCRAGISQGPTGRASGDNIACVTSVNPGRNPSVVAFLNNDLRSLIENTIWLPTGTRYCIERDFLYENPNAIQSRGTPGTNPDELPDFCEGERDQ